MKPNASTPPITPKKIRMNGSVLPCEISHGFRKLSMLETPKPQISMNTAQPVAPL